MTRQQKIDYLKALEAGSFDSLPIDPSKRALIIRVNDGICRVGETGETFPECERNTWVKTTTLTKQRILIFIYRTAVARNQKD